MTTLVASPLDDMTLGEALRLLRLPAFGCACIGGPYCCIPKYARARRVVAGAQQAANHLNALISAREVTG